MWGVSDASLNKTLLGPREPTNAVSFSRDGALLASSGQLVHIWDAATFAPLQSFSGSILPLSPQRSLFEERLVTSS